MFCRSNKDNSPLLFTLMLKGLDSTFKATVLPFWFLCIISEWLFCFLMLRIDMSRNVKIRFLIMINK